MPTEKEKWEEKKKWIDIVDKLTPEDFEQERRAAKGIGPKIVATLKEWFFKVMGLIIAPFGWALMWGLEKFSEVFEPELLDLTRDQLEQVKEIPDLPESIKKQVDYLLGERSAIHLAFLLPMAIGMMMGTIIGMMGAPVNLGRQFMNKLIRSLYLREDDAIRALFRKIITEEEFRENMARRGYREDQIDAFFEVSHFYPNPADLVRWQAREVFEPDMVERYGLDSEYGEIEKEPFYKAGMTDEQILNYWRAHWEHASWIQVTDMLHRGQLTQEEVWDWFRVVEIPPFWRDKLIAISYRPFTRVDVRRMHKVGVLDERGVFLAYADYGSSPFAPGHVHASAAEGFTCGECRAGSTAGIMTDFTIEYNKKVDNKENEEAIDFLRTEVLDGYRREMFPEPEVREMLTDLEVSAERIDFLISREDLKKEQALKDAYLKRYKTLFVEGIMNMTDLVAELLVVGLDQAEIEELVPIWDLERLTRIAHPSRANLDKFLKKGIIDEVIYRAEMRNMGWGDLYIDWFLAAAIEEEEEE